LCQIIAEELKMNIHQEPMIAVIGLGYVGLPLAVEFGKIRPV
jgi:UDP-N-acetyl-D-mannosaminuronate dehydrogenase